MQALRPFYLKFHGPGHRLLMLLWLGTPMQILTRSLPSACTLQAVHFLRALPLDLYFAMVNGRRTSFSSSRRALDTDSDDSGPQTIADSDPEPSITKEQGRVAAGQILDRHAESANNTWIWNMFSSHTYVYIHVCVRACVLCCNLTGPEDCKILLSAM